MGDEYHFIEYTRIQLLQFFIITTALAVHLDFPFRRIRNAPIGIAPLMRLFSLFHFYQPPEQISLSTMRKGDYRNISSMYQIVFIPQCVKQKEVTIQMVIVIDHIIGLTTGLVFEDDDIKLSNFARLRTLFNVSPHL
ncbi:hypothetical protein CEXT_368291 [Caerostris extrusa]|uniref:Uncharacterized protein n=1 Tax=Caerostris extrusa TaxID=172846 RepID=A0AAV4RQR8_CAEEX|nr:hypothetical protein CEXT_368291 [Caerostris extrusa]